MSDELGKVLDSLVEQKPKQRYQKVEAEGSYAEGRRVFSNSDFILYTNDATGLDIT